MTEGDGTTPPRLPALDGALGSPDFTLRLELPPGDDRPFSLAGAGLRAEGGCARGLDRLALPSGAVLSGLRITGATATGSLLTPLGVERRLRLGDGELIERLALALNQPLCFLEWASASPATLRLSWVHPPAPGGDIRWQAVERGLVVDRDGRRTFVVLSATPAELNVRPFEGDGGTALEVHLEVTAPVLRMGVGEAAGPDGGARLLRGLAHPEFVLSSARAGAQRALEERLAVEAPDPTLGETVSWGIVRLSRAGSLASPAADPPNRDRQEERRVRWALSSLAAGDAAPSKRLVARPPTGELTGAAALRYLELVTRYLAWTGDRGTIRGAWGAVRRAAVALVEANGGPGGVPAGLPEVVEDMGDDELAERMRERIEVRGVVAAARPEKGWNASGDDPGEPADDEARAAALIEAVVYGLLGAEPDAARGRLVLRPRFPAEWTRFTARNLVVGGAAVTLEYGRTGAWHRFVLSQTRGGRPLQVVFEPELVGSAVVAARVDGQPAELDPTSTAGRARVPVQIALDHERTVEVEIREGGD